MKNAHALEAGKPFEALICQRWEPPAKDSLPVSYSREVVFFLVVLFASHYHFAREFFALVSPFLAFLMFHENKVVQRAKAGSRRVEGRREI